MLQNVIENDKLLSTIRIILLDNLFLLIRKFHSNFASRRLSDFKAQVLQIGLCTKESGLFLEKLSFKSSRFLRRPFMKNIYFKKFLFSLRQQVQILSTIKMFLKIILDKWLICYKSTFNQVQCLLDFKLNYRPGVRFRNSIRKFIVHMPVTTTHKFYKTWLIGRRNLITRIANTLTWFMAPCCDGGKLVPSASQRKSAWRWYQFENHMQRPDFGRGRKAVASHKI